ncbi:class I histocompatibility antigen, F10 alpha chain-like isoform 2-T2 [Anomaloglossus baeobatrachus]
MFALALLLVIVPGGFTDTHSLRHYFIGVSAPGSGWPEFSVVGYVDDQQISSYSSDTGRTVPVAPWIKEKEGQEYWRQVTLFDKEVEVLFRLEVKLWKKRLNHTEVRPRVKVSGQEKGDTMKLHCQVYGFHPRAVDVRWMNGEDEVPLYETTDVIPNPDGTYQIRVSAEVTPKEGDRFSCYVDHSSLEEPLLVQWETKQSTVPAVIISAVVIIIVVLTSVGIIIYKKKKKNYSVVIAPVSSGADKPVTA